jgi:hypothetical protein
MGNAADVIGGKPIAVYFRCNAIDPLVAFYDIGYNKFKLLSLVYWLQTLNQEH